MIRKLAPLLVLLCAPACKNPSPPGGKRVSIIASAEIAGVVEPCGCTSDILGDVSRIRSLAKDGIWVDAGNLLYDADTYKGERQFQAEVKARCLAGIVQPAEVALGAKDVVGPMPDGLKLHAVNVAAPFVKPPTVRVLNGVRIGVIGAVAPGPLPGGLVATDPRPALARAVQQLAAAKPDVIVALLAMRRPEARQLLATVPGIDFGVFSVDTDEGLRDPEPVTNGSRTAFLVGPANEGRRVARLDVVLQGGSLALFADDKQRQAQAERLKPRIAKQSARVAELRSTAGTDPEFLRTSEEELRKLENEARRLAEASRPPATSYFTYELVPVRRSVPRDTDGGALIKQADQTIGASNLERAAKVEPPAPEPGKPSFVGQATCKDCHPSQAAFWETTQHARAWQTVVGVGKQYDYDCIGCHVSGWQKPGGSHLASVEKKQLTSVQCEVCHGPGSDHLKADEAHRKSTIVKTPDENLCGSTCHIKEHSDTFERAAYLRDVTGKGHGEVFRKSLGDGPTAHELRAAAKARVP